MPLSLLFLGLDEPTVALARALGEAEAPPTRLGFDPDAALARAAMAAGAVDRLASDPVAAAQQADLLLLSLTAQETRRLLPTLLAGLPPARPVLLTRPPLRATLAWAREQWPEAALLGALPIPALAEPDDPTQRYHGGVLAIAAPPGTPEPAAAQAVNLARRLGAEVFFLEAGELDSLHALTRQVPALLATALLRLLAAAPNRRDLEHLAGGPLAAATEAAGLVAAAELVENRDLLAPRLRGLEAEIAEALRLLEAGDADGLAAYLAEAAKARQAWHRARARGLAAERQNSEMPQRRTFWDSLLGRGPGRGEEA